MLHAISEKSYSCLPILFIIRSAAGECETIGMEKGIEG